MAIPPAPELPGDALLEVFIHPASLSPHRPLDETSSFSDGRRLEALGEAMVKAAYFNIMRVKWPNIQLTQLTTMVNSTIEGLMEKAVDTYRWRERVRGRPSEGDMQTREEAKRIFCTYAGAVHVEHGYQRLEDWIDALTKI